MVSIDIDVDGIPTVVEAIEDIKPDTVETDTWRIRVGAEYGVYLEKGTRNHPPYPFFEPAIRQFEAIPRTFVFKNTGQDIESMDDVDNVVEAVANALATQMRFNVAAQSTGGRSPGTHPLHPKIRTGKLVRSITVSPI